MKSLLFTAALIAVAVAGPVQPGGAGPAPIVPAPTDEYQPINVGPAIVDSYEPIHVGPAVVDSYEPINVGPAVVDSYEPIHVGPAVVDSYEPIQIGPAIIDNEASAVKAPVVQIILNINPLSQTFDVPVPFPINPEPVIVVDEAENPVDDIQVIDVNPAPVEVIDVQPAEIGTPVLPSPVITLPEELN